MSGNLVEILIKNKSCPTQCINSSIMLVPKSFGHKDFTIITGNVVF